MQLQMLDRLRSWQFLQDGKAYWPRLLLHHILAGGWPHSKGQRQCPVLLTAMRVEVLRFRTEDLPDVLEAIHGDACVWNAWTNGLGGTTLLEEICRERSLLNYLYTRLPHMCSVSLSCGHPDIDTQELGKVSLPQGPFSMLYIN